MQNHTQPLELHPGGVEGRKPRKAPNTKPSRTRQEGACKCKWRPFCHGVDVVLKAAADQLACRPNLGNLAKAS